MFNKRTTVVLLAGLLLLGLAVALIVGQAAFAQGETLLQLSDLPEGAMDLKDGAYEEDEASHPLNSHELSTLRQLPEGEQQAIFSYKKVRSFSAFVPSKEAVVAEFTYEYATAEQAGAAVQILQEKWIPDGKAEVLTSEPLQGGGLSGRVFTMRDGDGYPLYWFVGSEGKTLMLVIVNGLEQPGVDALADGVIERVAEK